MRFAYHDDKTKWGRTVAQVAESRGHTIDQRDPDVAFVRLLTFEPERTFGFSAISRFRERQIPVFPGGWEWYDNKLEQYPLLKEWLPETTIFWCNPAESAVNEMEFPIVSKAHTGAQSRNVRLLRSIEEAQIEAHRAFSCGIPLKPNGWQKNYLYWQKFIPGNEGDIRVCVAGAYSFGLLRGNRDDLPFASGSGRLQPILDMQEHRIRRAFELAHVISNSLGVRWQAYDFVFDPEDRIYCLEASSAWNEKAYNECPLFHRETLQRTWLTASTWPQIAVDEMERLSRC